MPTRFIWALALGMGLAAAVHAESPGALKHPYDITAEAGPWCISVTCYFENIDLPPGRDFAPGEMDRLLSRTKSRELSIDFVSLLRAEYQLPAYMYNRGDEERKKEEQRVAEQRNRQLELIRKLGGTEAVPPEKKWIKRYAHVQDQYVVLIGGFPDQETARRALDQIRKHKAPPEKFMNKVIAGYGDLAQIDTKGPKSDGHGMFANPFKTAMVVPNPTGPKIKPPTADAEELARGLAALNADNPYSLLKHGGKMTLAVKIYRIPARVSGLGKNEYSKGGSNMDKIYEATAKQAEQLAAFLRHPQLNFEAYVLHTHAASIVTVGVFNGDQDPRLQTMQAQLAKLKLQTNGGVEMEQLMSPPLPIPIPKSK